jgi:hypothetical protein
MGVAWSSMTSKIWNCRMKQDKGHYQELIELARFLKGEKSNIISFQECVKAMKITFGVQKLLRETSR